jgi:hypothetical protein
MTTAPRFTPIVERPVRTEREIRKRREQALKQARIAELEAGIKAREAKQ